MEIKCHYDKECKYSWGNRDLMKAPDLREMYAKFKGNEPCFFCKHAYKDLFTPKENSV